MQKKTGTVDSAPESDSRAASDGEDCAANAGLPSPPLTLTNEGLGEAAGNYFLHFNSDARSGRHFARAMMHAAEAGESLEAYMWSASLCAHACYYLNDEAEMQRYLDLVRGCKVRLSTPAEHGMYFSILGTALGQSGQLAAACDYLLQALVYGRGRRECLRSYRQALFSLADNYRQSGNYSSALSLLLSMDRLPPGTRRAQERIIKTDLVLGLLYRRIGDSEKARFYYEQYLDACRKKDFFQGIASAYLEIAEILIEDLRLSAAQSYLRKAAAISENNHNIRTTAFIQLANVRILSLQGKSEEALALLATIQQGTNFSDFSDVQLQLLLDTGMLLLSQDKIEPATEYLQQARALAERDGFRHSLLEILLQLADIAGSRAASAEEAALRKRAAALHEEILGVRRMRQVIKIELREQHKSAEREAEELRRQQLIDRDQTRGIEDELQLLALKVGQRDKALGKLRELLGHHTEAKEDVRDLLRQQFLATIDSSLGREESDPLFAVNLQHNYGATVASLKSLGPQLTPTEIKICLLLRLKFDSKEIATLLFKSLETIRTHRRRIRRKLTLPHGMNLTKFLLEL